MSLSFQKRSSDAPFLAGEELGLDARADQLSTLQLTPEDLRRWKAAAEEFGATLNELVITGLAILLSRWTRQDVIAISAFENEFCAFRFEDDLSFRQAAEQARLRHPTASEDLAGPGARYEFREESNSLATNFQSDDRECDLRLTFDHDGRLELSGPSGVWNEPGTEFSLGYLQSLLNAATENPTSPVQHLALWSNEPARAFFAGLNATGIAFAGESSVPRRVSEQVKKNPSETALLSEGRRYTYRELEDLSTALAVSLVAAGAGPNRAVAVCMDRSVDLPMALLAVLKSGSYYVPLDPHNPSQRLQGILEECHPVALLSNTRVADLLTASMDLGSTTVLRVDQPTDQAEGHQRIAAPQASLPETIDAKNLAYTIYTSGTTGKPKGVQIKHGSLLNAICSMAREPGISQVVRTLAVAPISFDIATLDMFLPLCTGGTLVLADDDDSIDPYRLADLIVEHDVTYLQATPATWRMLVTSGWKGKRDLKMITGGEAIPRELANDLIRLGGDLWNCYGPTETTIYSGVIRLRLETGIVPVGPPIANTSFYVMDKSGFPVPPGIPGELYIGGVGVSAGYVGRPELTAQRFVTDKFGPDPSAKLFCTGDLVRIVNGDQLEFFGRLDHQVKLRGFRIELGEIETVLRTHPSIRDAVAVLREDLPGEPRLVAYVIPSDSKVDGATLRDHAAKFLPDYMLPALIVTMDRYPLSASGKINRKALPVPESVAGQIAPEHPVSAAAESDLEAKLLKIFRDVLRNETIGVTDNFFRFGGYSLLTVRLFSRIDRELRVRLPISLLFDTPTVRALAAVIEKGTTPSVIVPIRPYGKSAPIFIVQSYLLYGVMLDIVEPDRPIYGVRENENLNVEDRARKFAAEILKVYSDGPVYLAGWCAAGTLTVEIARHLHETGHAVGLVALFDAERPGWSPPSGPHFWLSTLAKKAAFHSKRLSGIPWEQRFTYILQALGRNWDWAVESYYTANYRSMLWLQKRFGVSLSEAAFNNVYASLTALRDFSVQPYPGKLNLFRAADVPNFAVQDETLGWGTVAMEGVQVDFVPGDHVSMFKNPHVETLANLLQGELQKSERLAIHN